MCSNHEKPERHCYRCNTCLCVYACTHHERAWPGQIVPDMGCLVCGNDDNVEYLGKIRLDEKLEKEELACKCDDRCVWASGPVCNCACGGANHQSGVFGYTQVVRTEEKKIRLTCLDPETVAKHQEIARVYLDAVAAAEQRKNSYVGPAWLSRMSYRLMRAGIRGRAQKNRLEKLNAAYTQAATTL